jgi:hypothetical protein
MRSYILLHEGLIPPGFSSQTHAAYTVEDKARAFTSLAVMKRNAEEKQLLKHSFK